MQPNGRDRSLVSRTSVFPHCQSQRDRATARCPPANRYDYGEQRLVTFGLLQGRVIAVVHTEREDCIRIISARKATKYEQKAYFEQLSN